MVELNFDASQVESVEGPGSVIPNGTYKAIIEKAERRPTRAEDGHYLNLQLRVIEGKFQNRVVFDILNLWNKSEKASAIAKSTMKDICEAVGKITVRDSSELCSLPLAIKVTSKHNDYKGELENKVAKYLPASAADGEVAASQKAAGGFSGLAPSVPPAGGNDNDPPF